ncbi:hypothetical protein HDE79_001102 [Rhodanobacter sp. MP1X3]|nr:hypothetical protein [Rhodanobacter sp. MP1X3]
MSIPLRAYRPRLTAAQGSWKSRAAFPTIHLNHKTPELNTAQPFDRLIG